MEHDLHTFMAQISAEMASEYQRIYARAADDPGTAGDQGEKNWANLLQDWLPSTYHVATKGRLIGTSGEMSPQVDVVVLKPAYPRKLLDKQIWLAGGVAAAFECKTTLTAAHVTDAIQRSLKFKELFEPRTGTPRRELRSPLVYGLLAHSHSWKGGKSDPVANIERALDGANSAISHPSQGLDLLCVADLATWYGTYIASYHAAWQKDNEAQLTALFGGPFGPMSGMISSAAHEASSEAFPPIGVMLNSLTRSLAWEDPTLRDIADYYRLAKLGGQGSGAMRPWPLSVYSAAVAGMMGKGKLSNGEPWDDWSIGG